VDCEGGVKSKTHTTGVEAEKIFACVVVNRVPIKRHPSSPGTDLIHRSLNYRLLRDYEVIAFIVSRLQLMLRSI
jgi:hypothetical protein